MNAVIMDDAVVGDDSLVGALSFVKAEMQIPNRKVVTGNPAKILKDVTDEMLTWKTNGTALYQKLPLECHEELKETTSLKKPSNQKSIDFSDYKTWKKSS